MSDGTVRFITREKDTEMFAQIARLSRSTEHSNLYENDVLKEINKVSVILGDMSCMANCI